jgi:hypothetical protein
MARNGCGNELHGLRHACFFDLGSFAHLHPPVKGCDAPVARGNVAISGRALSEVAAKTHSVRTFSSSRSARATRGLGLNRRALVRAMRTEDAAVAGLWMQQRLAVVALIEPLASINGHRLFLRVTALRARDGRLQGDIAHFTEPASPMKGTRPRLWPSSRPPAWSSPGRRQRPHAWS